MSDWFQTVVDRDATESESPGLGVSVHQWLVAEGIVCADGTDCVLENDTGFPPGPEYHKATDGHDAHLLDLRTNGMEIIANRSVFHSGQGGFELVCSACSERFEAPDGWGDAVSEWWEVRGPGMFGCQVCGKTQPIDQWDHDPAWAFASLGFTFWNWPPLADEFVRQLGERLGHRVVLVTGKL